MQAKQSVAVERRAPGATIVNDIGLLSAEQIPAFWTFLVESGLQVRDSGAGQFFHVRLPELPRWLPIERGRAGAPVTPDVLRPFIASFLKKPLDRVMGEVRAARQAAERVVARAAFAQPVVVEPAAYNLDLPTLLGQAEAPARAAMNAVAELSPHLAINAPVTHEFQSFGEQRAVQRALKAPAPAAQVVSHQGQALKSAPTDDAQYLSDLRDDFALHAPITLTKNATKHDLEVHVSNRWEYADMMMAARTTKAGD